MATIAIFPSVLGVRPGVLDLAARLEAAGHTVRVHDQVGTVHDTYEPAIAQQQATGTQALLSFADRATADLPPGAFVLGLSAGGALAEHVAITRDAVAGCVVLGGGLPVRWLEAPSWPAGVPLQLHQTADDPWRDEGGNEGAVADAQAAGAEAVYYEYPGSGHLFFDASLPAEYDPASAELFLTRLESFLSTAHP